MEDKLREQIDWFDREGKFLPKYRQVRLSEFILKLIDQHFPELAREKITACIIHACIHWENGDEEEVHAQSKAILALLLQLVHFGKREAGQN